MRKFLSCIFLITNNFFYSTIITTTTTTSHEALMLTNTIPTRSLGYILYDIGSTTPLNGDEIYNSGTIDVSEYSLVSIIVKGTPSNATGTLYIEFSPDGTNWDQASIIPIANLDTEPPHTALPISRYCRARYVNNTIDQDTFRLQLVFHRYGTKGLTARLAQTINDTTDVENVRAVLMGKNAADSYENVLISNENALAVDVRGSAAAFGEISTTEPTAVTLLQFIYGLNPALIALQAHNNGTIITENSMIKLSTGASNNSSAVAYSRNPIQYNPGQGSFCRFTGIFSPGVTGATQFIGVGDQANGFFFGYQNETFGILRRQNGSPEVRTLTITQGSGSNQNISITLDGNTKTGIAVTNSNNATTTANQIANADFSTTGSGWSAYATGNKVEFIAWNAASRTGTYSLSGSSIGGSFVRTVAGRTPQESFTPQTGWNIDGYNGTGKSLVNIDPSKGNVYQIRWQWLGFGAIVYSIENPSTGILETVHRERYANTHTLPSVSNPTLPLYYGVHNTNNNSNITIYSGSIGGFVDGKETRFGIRKGVSALKTNINGTERPIITLRNKIIHSNQINRIKSKINFVTQGSTHSSPVIVNYYLNSTLTNASFNDVDNNSNMQYDTSANAFSNGTLLFSVYLPSGSKELLSLIEDLHGTIMPPGSTITITARAETNQLLQSGSVFIGINFIELL